MIKFAVISTLALTVNSVDLESDHKYTLYTCKVLCKNRYIRYWNEVSWIQDCDDRLPTCHRCRPIMGLGASAAGKENQANCSRRTDATGEPDDTDDEDDNETPALDFTRYFNAIFTCFGCANGSPFADDAS